MTRQLICIKNDGYEVSLILGKAYVNATDASLAFKGMVRIIDESGDLYVYPQAWFMDPAPQRKVPGAV